MSETATVLRERIHRWRFRWWPRRREAHERHYWMPDPYMGGPINERICVLCNEAQFSQLHYWPEARGFA